MPGGALRSAQPFGRMVARARPVELPSQALLALRASLAPAGAGSSGSFELALFDGTAITIAWQRSEPGFGGSISWLGEVVGKPRSQVVLTLRGDILQGNISWPGARYHLRYAGRTAQRAIHALQEIDASQFPPEHPPGGPAIPPAPPAGAALSSPSMALDAPAADDGSRIDVMVLYTPAAVTAAGGTSAMEALIDLAVTETNQGYLTSGINTRINLVHTAIVDYTESAGDTFGAALDALTYTADGQIDGIHALRDTYGADLVALLIDEPGSNSCGLGWIFNGMPDYGFQVTDWNCATGSYSFAHEFGHNQGALHDWRLDATPGYNHGYVEESDGWRTIMAYNDSANCPAGYCAAWNFGSNPDRNHNVLFDASQRPKPPANLN